MRSLTLALLAVSAVAFGVQPEGLLTEYRVAPTGLDAPVPRLSWQLPAGTQRQTGYELEINGFHCGRRCGGEHVNVAWPGKLLQTGTRYRWRVRTWDEKNVPSDWSAPTEFTTGVMKASDWKAKWIGPNAALRPNEDMKGAQWITAPADAKGVVTLTRTFVCPAVPKGAYVEMVHLGVAQHQIKVNGKMFNLHSGHRHDWRYARFRDMTPWLVAGTNCVEVKVFVHTPKAGEPVPHLRVPAPNGVRAFVAKIAFPDGRTLVTDDQWSSPDGPVRQLGRVRETAYGKQVVLRTECVAPAFEKTFTVASPVKSAVLHITGAGYYVAYLDGKKIGDKVLDPAPTAYDKRILYSTYRLDDALAPGKHTLKILVGHGFYDVRAIATWNWDTAPWRNFPRAIAQLALDYVDGEHELVVTDGTWRQVASDVSYDDIREGEVVGVTEKARQTFAQKEVYASEVPGPGGRLVAANQPGARVVRTLVAKQVKDLGNGACLIAFPENLAGWMRLTLRGQKKGDIISIRYDERANANLTPARDSVRDGLHDYKFSTLRDVQAEKNEYRKIDAHFRYPTSYRVTPIDAAFQTDRFISSGAREEMYEPRFTFNGFQYVYVRGLAQVPRVTDCVACVIHTDFRTSGAFACSDETLNKLMTMADRAYRSNFVDGMPTDCPHREKNGWTGDAAIAVDFAQYRFDNTAGYEKWIRDILDAQLPDGNIPGIVPTSGWGYHWGNGPVWDSALSTIPWALWRYRGNRQLLDEIYPALVRLNAYTATKANAEGLVRHGLADWVAVDQKHIPDVEFTSSCYYYQAQRLATEIAKLKGLTAEAAEFNASAERTRKAAHAKFHKGNGVYANGRQTAQAVAITFGIVPPELYAAARQQLIRAVEKEDVHIDVGLIGMKHVFRALSEVGRTDLAFKMLTNATSPSPVEWIQKGGTTLWEDWGDGASRNHIMFGDFPAWAYQYLAGIRLKPAQDSLPAIPTGAPGFTEILLAPVPIAALDWVTAETDTPQGKIKSAWKRDGAKIRYTFTVPPGATAEIRLPGERVRQVDAGTYAFVTEK